MAFRVSDAKAARQFYGTILGLSEDAPSGRLSYRIGSHQHVVLEPGLPPNEDERLSHLAFETPDVKAMGAYLTSRGFQITQPPERCDPTAIRVNDPDGHPIEFIESRWPPDPAEDAGGHALSKRLLHAGLTVRDEESAHRFYRDALGFSEIWRGGRPEGVTQWINMRVPDGTDYLEYMLVTDTPDRVRRGSLHHVALLVPDIQAAWEEVGRRSAASPLQRLSPPNVGVNGRYQLNLFDPDGTRTELMEPYRVR
jgi:lactoylglutathione lyase